MFSRQQGKLRRTWGRVIREYLWTTLLLQIVEDMGIPVPKPIQSSAILNP